MTYKRKEVIGNATMLLIDCMEYMKGCADKSFDLAIVDPPYGIGASSDARFGLKHKGAAKERTFYEVKKWDANIPAKEYFDEVFRVSKNQIIWGVNYYPDSRLVGGRVYWDKQTPDDYSNSDGELAYKSFGHGVDCFRYQWHGMLQGDMKRKESRIHPTQKPVKLYEWLLTNYAKEGQKILDTHSGSGSNAIACNNLGFEIVACEIDEDYFNASCERIAQAQKQQRLFA